MSAALDCLFVHTPKADNHYLPLGDFFNITYLPMGLLALAQLLQRSGHSAEVMHLGVEWLVDPGRTVLDQTRGRAIRAIGLSLYWHYQSYDAIEVARALKAQHPEAVIFLGGVTASYFAAELLEHFAFLDAVLPGHAEGSALALLDAIKAGRPLSDVPGIVTRAGDRVLRTPGRAPAPPLDELVFGDLSALHNADIYATSFGFPLAYSREFSAEENRRMLSMGRAFFPLFTGRGCPWLCTFCGGNRDTLRRINGSAKVQWRAHDRVIQDIRLAAEAGYRTMSLCFDPTPTRDSYYVELFEKIRAAGLEVDFYFECWGLPTRRFLDAFRRTFPSPESYVALSPDAGDEEVRRRNKMPFYTDAELLEAMDLLAEREIAADVFFTLALPGEHLAQARKTAALKRRIAEEYPNARRVMTWTVQLEPGSPQYERPADYGMITDRSCFMDFYRAHGGDRADTYSSLGFKVLDYFGDERDQGGIADFERHLQHLKCMEFCFLARDPRRWSAPEAGRAHCLERRQILARRRGHPEPQRLIGEGVYYEDALAEERQLRGSRPRHSWLRAAP